MKKISVLAAAAALVMGATSLAQAQPRDDRRGPPPHHSQGHYQQDHRRDHGHHVDPRRPGPPPHAHARRGAGPDHRWTQGYRVPPQYRGKNYVVQDWRRHRLSAPPRGYQWVQYGGDYMLVAIATGVISQLILGGY